MYRCLQIFIDIAKKLFFFVVKQGNEINGDEIEK
jgi:hypothetical protein